MFLYQDRQDAGSELAGLLMTAAIKDPLMLALPKGGVLVASVISHDMNLPFEVLVTRPIGHPGGHHLDIGAMSEDGNVLLTEDINCADPRIREVINEEKLELKKMILLYRGGQELPRMNGREIILVDDGLAAGGEALVAAKFLKREGAARVILAVPVAPEGPLETLKKYVDEIICPHRESVFHSVGEWYQDFADVTDKEVMELLGRSRPTS